MKSFQVIALTLSMLMIISMVKGRWLDLEKYSTSVISVGVHNISNNNPSNLRLEISNSSMFYAEKRCEFVYGFFPCADTMLESVFLMFMYMYFMILGEEWTRKGSKVLFRWIGDKAFGESVFGVLKALPRIALFVVPGVLSSASDAQNQVGFGVSMYAGLTVITLTLIWGIRIILSRQKLEKGSSPVSDDQQDSSLEKGSSPESDDQQDSSIEKGSSPESDDQQDSLIKCLSLKHKLSFLTDMGVNIDKETREMAVTMLCSLIPFVFVGLLHFIKTPAMTLLELIVSVASLLLYFHYQVKNSWIRYRSLANLNQEKLRTRFFYHVIRLADFEDLVDKQGKIDVTWFKRIFDEADNNKDKHISQNVDNNGDDKDKHISHDELEVLVKKMFMMEDDNISKESKEYAKVAKAAKESKEYAKVTKASKEYAKVAKAAILIDFDRDKNRMISWEEFKQGCTNWLEEAISSGSEFENIWNRVKQKVMMRKFLEQVLEKHRLEDGKPDRQKIEGLLSQHDKDGDDVIRIDELKELIKDGGDDVIRRDDLKELIKDGGDDVIRIDELKKFIKTHACGIALDHNKVLSELVKGFKHDDKRLVGKKEFVDGFIKRIKKKVMMRKFLEQYVEDGKPDRKKIEGLFSQLAKNGDHVDLKEFSKTHDFGIALAHNKVLSELVKDFEHENQLVGKQEFVDGFIKRIEKTIHPKKAIENFEEDWAAIHALLNPDKPKATIVYAIFGIAITIIITSPFIASVKQFSTAAHIPFLFTSFVMAPIAMKAKMVIVALLNVQHHVRKNASLTFSEIYDQLVMDNLISSVSLLLVVYIRGLSWTYSAEVLVIMIPCAIVGVFAIKHDTYPLWASILAILLYPVSVSIYYVLPNAS